MVNLPPIVQNKGSLRDPQSELIDAKRSSSTILFCGDCSRVLPSPVSRVNPELLKQYRDKCALLKHLERLYCDDGPGPGVVEDASSLETDTRSSEGGGDTQGEENVCEESKSVSLPVLPLLHLSQAGLFARKSFEDLGRKETELIPKRIPRRCKIVNLESERNLNKQKPKSRFLPAITDTFKPNDLLKVCKRVGAINDKVSKAVKMIAEPDHVVFYNAEVGKSYEKKIKIKNISLEKCEFIISPPEPKSPFRISWNKDLRYLAPGMSVDLAVSFQCSYSGDVSDEVIINISGNEELAIDIYATSPSPHLVEVNEYNCNLWDHIFVDSLIDCGSHFVGDGGMFTFHLKNIGKSARFCFISESDWQSLQFTIDSSNQIFVESFAIQPMYFSVEKGQKIEILVSYYIPSEGVHAGQLFLLCDNSTLKRIDLVADGYKFNPACFQVLAMMKTFDANIEDDDSAEFYIDFGSVATFSKNYQWLIVFNIGGVTVSYHWELKVIQARGGPRPAPSLPQEAIKIAPASGRLLANSLQKFYIQCDTDLVKPGKYRTLLSLFVDDLPMKCIPINLYNKLIPSIDEEIEGHSIEVQRIEVWVECVRPHIVLIPYSIDFSEGSLISGCLAEHRVVTVQNISPEATILIWICNVECACVKVKIEPLVLVAQKFSSVDCFLSVEAVEEGTFCTSFLCCCLMRNVMVELKIKGVCLKKELVTVTESVHFDIVKRGSKQEASLIARNVCGVYKTRWSLNELKFNEENYGQLEQSNNLGVLSACEGIFCHKDSEVLVKYELNTEAEGMWCSVLDWGGQYVPVMANIQQLEVSLSCCDVVVKPLYRGVTSTVQLYVYSHTCLPTALFWGNPMFHQDNDITVEISPRFTVLQPLQGLLTKIRLTPHSLGLMENLYIPCFVEGNTRPLLLKINGTVKGLKIRVEWESETKHCCVVWPLNDDEDSENMFENSTLSKCELCPCPPNSFLNSSSESFFESSFTYDGLTEVSENESVILNENKLTHLLDVIQESAIEEENKDEQGSDISEASSIPYLNWPIVGGRYYPQEPVSEEFVEHMKGLFVLEEIRYSEFTGGSISDPLQDKNALCFHNVPLRQAVSKEIFIKNDTLINSFYEVWILNNFERIQQPDETPVIEKVKKKIKSRSGPDEWMERASKDRGLTVFVEPARGDLLQNDYVIVQITVFALSWGNYTDDIVIKLKDLKPLRVQLSVSVRVGLSEYPVAVKPLIRFGCCYLGDHEQHRYLEVENTSTVPLLVSWQLFTSTFSDESTLAPTPKCAPFSVMLIDHDHDASLAPTPFHLEITPYHGAVGSRCFGIDSSYTFLKPHSSEKLRLKFKPWKTSISGEDDVRSEIKRADLIGYIHLSNEAKYIAKTESCLRFDGLKLEPLKVKLEANVEVPALSLLNVPKSQLRFECSAFDVMTAKDKVWWEERVVTVQNQFSTPIKARVCTVGLFYLSKIDYTCKEQKLPKDYVFLQPGESCEITIMCEVKETTLYECFDEDSEQFDELMEPSVVERGLIVFHHKYFNQNIKLELLLHQPVLQISKTHLTFGKVTVTSKKTLMILITAPLRREYFKAVLKNAGNTVFSLDVSSGILSPNCEFPLLITFSPKSFGPASDSLIIKSCMEKVSWEIPLSGIGTLDNKSHDV